MINQHRLYVHNLFQVHQVYMKELWQETPMQEPLHYSVYAG
jgi:hypothetical protein